MKYIYQSEAWPHWIWDDKALLVLLARIRHKQGLLLGSMLHLDFDLRMEASLTMLTADVVCSEVIEGEIFPDKEVRSSISRHLGLDIGGLVSSSRNVDGFVSMILDATSRYNTTLDKNRLCAWHSHLFAGLVQSDSTTSKIIVGDWRKDTHGRIQLVSGGIGKEVVHYETPEARTLEHEIQMFMNWFNADDTQEKNLDPILKAAIAHFWFVSIHPFEDGNGRIARAIADMALARADKSSERFYSMSAVIERKRNSYYEVLQRTQMFDEYSVQHGALDITSWLLWFLECLEEAINYAYELLDKTLYKAKVWNFANKYALNPRQEKVLTKLLDDFEGNLTSSKYAKLVQCSQDTALRDISLLLEFGVLKKSSKAGRSTSYELSI